MLLHALATVLFSSHAAAIIQPNFNFTNNVIYTPKSRESLVYPRYAELSDGTTIVSAAHNINPQNPKIVASVFQTKNNGTDWELISTLDKEIAANGFIAEPHIYQLTQAIGDYEAGTILMSGAQWGVNNTRVDMYASKDQARTWTWIGKVAEGAASGDTNVFEPFLLEYKGQLVIYYSDTRDPDHAQILSHQVTSDLKTWGPVVPDVKFPTKSDRPGMTIITYIPPTDQWMLVHEFGPRAPPTNWPVYYRLAASPLEFEHSVPIPLTVPGGAHTPPSASPYVVWSPHGGANGTLLVASSSSASLFTNTYAGASDKWEEHKTQSRAGYAPALQIPKNDPSTVLIYVADAFYNFWDLDAGVSHTPLSVTAVSLEELALS